MAVLAIFPVAFTNPNPSAGNPWVSLGLGEQNEERGSQNKLTIMSTHARCVFSIVRLPARLTLHQTAEILGFQPHDIAKLIAAGLLQPLGSPAPNAPKYFAAVEVERLAKRADWLGKATRNITQHWVEKNSRRSSALPCYNIVEKDGGVQL